GKGLPHINGANIKIYEHGDASFHEALATCNGIVSTAGHTLLSEAMSLGIPVYAIPLPVYEQHMNAHIIEENKFGISRPRFEAEALEGFLQNLPQYAKAIAADKA